MLTIVTSGTIQLASSSWDNIANKCLTQPYVKFNDNKVGEPTYNTTNKRFENISGSCGYTYSTWIATQALSNNAAYHAFRIIASGTFGTSSLESWTSTVAATTTVVGVSKSGFIMTPSGTTNIRFEHCPSGSVTSTTSKTISGQICQTYSFTLGKRS
jgi:hypothetical protein